MNEFTGTAANETFSAAQASFLSILDNIDGGAGVDTLGITDASLTAFSLPTAITTIAGIENFVLNHASDLATELTDFNVSTLADARSVTIFNVGVASPVTVTGSSNLTSVTVNGNATNADVTVATVADSGTNGATTTDRIATVTLIGLTGDGTLSSEALTTLNINNVGGTVTNTDTVATDTRALTVNVAGGSNLGVVDAGATTATVNITGATTTLGANSAFNGASTLNLNTSAVLTAGTITASAATTVNYTANAAVTAATLTTANAIAVNVAANAAITASTVGAATTTALNLSGAAVMTLTQTAATAGVITSTGAGARTLVNAISAGQTYTGADGVDTITVGGNSTTIATNGGNDVITVTAALATGGSVNAGSGDADVLKMTGTLAATLDDNTNFNATVSGFERLELTDAATVNLANIDGLNHVTLSGGGTASLSGAVTGATLVLNAEAQSSTIALGTDVTGAAANDALNVTLTNAASTTYGTVVATGFETVALTATESGDLTAGTIDTATVTLNDATAKTITVAGNANLALTFAGTALTSLDASAKTRGGVSYTTGNLAAAATLRGGAGNDTLDAKGALTAAVSLFGNDGNDILLGSVAIASTLDGGNGNDTLTGGVAADTINGGDGTDTFVFTSDSTQDDVAGLGDVTGVVVNLGSTALTSSAIFTATGRFLPTTLASVAANTATYLFNNESATNASVVDTLTSIENLTGTDLVDYIVGSSSANVINGAGGVDVIDISSGGADTIVTGTLAADADLIIGFGTTDVLDLNAFTTTLVKAYAEIATSATDITTDANVIVIGGTTTIADAATAIAADVTVTGTVGIIVVSNGTDTLIYGTDNLGTNGTEVLLATLVGITGVTNLTTLSTDSFSV